MFFPHVDLEPLSTDILQPPDTVDSHGPGVGGYMYACISAYIVYCQVVKLIIVFTFVNKYLVTAFALTLATD